MYDVIIIGAGPAGLSAALYTSRANLSTLIIGKDRGVLERVEKIENYFGVPAPVSGGWEPSFLQRRFWGFPGTAYSRWPVRSRTMRRRL